MISELQQLSFEKVLIPTGVVTAGIVLLGLLGVLVRSRQRHDILERHWFSRLVYALFFISVVSLAATSFGSILQKGHMQHYALLAHVAVAGAFVFLHLAVAVMYLPIGSTSKLTWWWEKWSAWGFVVSGLITSATMFLSMLSMLDTAGLIQALQVHRIAGLATAVFVVLHLFALIVGRLGWR